MISALDQGESNNKQNDEIQEFKKKISDLELEIEKEKSDHKMKISMF